MAINQKQWLVILSVLLAVGAAFWYFKKMRSSTQANLPSPIVEEPKVKGHDNFPLKTGSRGKRVEQLQNFLQIRKGAKFPKSGIDGVFGQETLENLQKYVGVSEVSEENFKTSRMSDFKTYTYKS